MEELISYHGTSNANCQEILKSKVMRFSRGSNHWLGDGFYLYEDDFYAYRWCVLCYKDKKQDRVITSRGLIDNYKILIVYIQLPKERIFDLTKPEPKSIINTIYQELLKRPEYVKEFEVVKKVEGVILNYLFNELNYGEDYDLIRATFVTNRNNYSNQMRLNFLCETQLCIRNTEIIKKLEDFKYDNKIIKYNSIWKDLYTDINAQRAWYNPNNWAY